jgi:hypothetical protein
LMKFRPLAQKTNCAAVQVGVQASACFAGTR